MNNNLGYIKKSDLAILLIGLFAFLFIIVIRWNGLSGQNYRQIIKSDGLGYYHYIPTILNGELSKQEINNTFLIETNNGRILNKYTIGTALCISPFILPVYIIDSVSGNDIDYYSEYYQKAVSIAALFYLLFGLFALKKLLILFNIESKIINFSLFAIFFGTNLSYYALIEPSMSHIYSFTFISLFFWQVKKISSDVKAKAFVILSILLAIIVLIRPINIIILLAIPFLIDNIKIRIIDIIKSNFKAIAVSSLLFIAVISIQAIIWNIQTGDWFIWSYKGEGFYFSKPAILEFLFSFRKGLFIYNPLLFLITILFFYYSIFNKKKGFKVILFLLPLIYILSSWWNWYYGDSYGSRVTIDYLSFFVILFATSMQSLAINRQKIIVILSSFLILLNTFQAYQYYYQIMSKFDMNMEKYNYIFFKYGEENRNILGGNNDIIQYNNKSEVIKTISIKELNTDIIYNIESEILRNYKSSFLKIKFKVRNYNNDLSHLYFQIAYKDKYGNNINIGQFKANEVPLMNNESRYNNYSLRLIKPTEDIDKVELKLINLNNIEYNVSDITIKIVGIID